MKKRLLFALALALGTMSSFAYELGDYIYTPTAKLKITSSDNLIQNGSFASQTTNWYGQSGTSAVDGTNWSVQDAAGPNGENVLQSLNAGDGLDNYAYQSVALTSGNIYVVSFQVKGTGSASTSTTVGSANYVDAFTNADGSVDKTTARQIFTATDNVLSAEWQTISDTIVCENDEYLVVGVGRLDAGTQVTNFAVQIANVVYDTRIAERRLAYDRKILALSEFTEGKTDFQENVDAVAAGLESGLVYGEISIDDVDAMTGLMQGLAEQETAYLDANSYDLVANGNISGSAIWGTKVQKGSGYYGDWYVTGGRWFGYKDADYIEDYMPSSYALPANYAQIEKALPAGKYFFQIDVKGYAYKAGSGIGDHHNAKYTVIDYDTPATNQLYIGSDSAAVETVSARDYQTYFVIADVAAGEDNTVKNLIAGVKHGAYAKGGCFLYSNPVLRLISPTAKDVVTEYIEEGNKATQLNAAKVMIDSANVIVNKTEYPMGKTKLQAATATQTALYNTLAETGATELLTVLDADGNAVIDENGNTETKTVADSLMQVMRNMRTAIQAYYGENAPLTDLKKEVASAQTIYDDPANAGAMASYKTALATEIEKANAIIAGLAAQTDSIEGDRAAADAQILALQTATENFTASTASYANPSEIAINNPLMTSAPSTGWTTTGSDTGNGRWKHASIEDFEGGKAWTTWRGYTAYTQNNVKQTVTLTHAGVYEFITQAYACNQNSSRDGGMQSDNKVVYFAKLNESADSIQSIHVHTYYTYNDTIDCGAKEQYTSVPDYFVITYKKTDDVATVIEFGFDASQNASSNKYGFGGNHIRYYGDYDKYVSDVESTLQAEIEKAKALLEKYNSITFDGDKVDGVMSDSVEYKVLNNAIIAATSAIDGTTLAFPISSTVKAPYLMTYVGWVEPTTEEAGAKALRAQTVTDTDKKAALETKALLNLQKAEKKYQTEAEAVHTGVKGIVDNTTAVKVAAKGVYNIAGQKVAEKASNLPAGLYIVNGKKIVVK